MKSSGKKLSTPTVIGIILCIIALVFVVSGVLMYFAANKKESKAKEEAPTAPAVQTANDVPAAAVGDYDENGSQPLIPFTEPAFYPDDMGELLGKGGITFADFAKNMSLQLVIVHTDGTGAEIRFFENKDGVWDEDKSLSCKGSAGSGEAAAPKGLYAIGEAFYQKIVPETGLDRFHITDETYWMTDPDSPDYNRRVELTSGGEKAVKLGGVSDYKYGFVIDRNVERDPEKGCATFFHAGNSPAQGCISAPESNMLNLLKHLDAKQNPFILVV